MASGRGRSRTGWPWWAWTLAALAGLAVLALVVIVIWPIPTLFYSYVPDPKDRSAAEATTRTGMLAGLAGLAALGTFWLNSRVYRVTARTFEITEQGHITDRYTKAIGQLGDQNVEVRLGAIYALERLAIDSERDHPTVVEVLSGFVRERASAALTRRRREAGRRTAHPPSLGVDQAARMATDVQAAVTVLGRLPIREYVSRGDLSGARLSGIQLNWARLARANLERVDLTGAEAMKADLNGTTLNFSNLTSARLRGTNLTETSLFGATLRDADLFGATLREADLSGATLTGAYLQGTELTGADLSGADLTGAKGLDDLQLALAVGDLGTKLPSNIARPEAWPRTFHV